MCVWWCWWLYVYVLLWYLWCVSGSVVVMCKMLMVIF